MASQALKPKRIVLCEDTSSNNHTSEELPVRPILILPVGVNFGYALPSVVSFLQEFRGVTKIFDQELSRNFFELCQPTSSIKKRSIIKKAIQDQVQNAKNNSPEASHFLFCPVRENGGIPFPFGRPFELIRRPDLVEIVQLLMEDFDIRILVVMENPVHLYWSLLEEAGNTLCEILPQSILERGHCNPSNLAAKVIENQLENLSSQLQAFSTSFYRLFWMDDFLKNPKTGADPFLEYFGFAKEDSEWISNWAQATRPPQYSAEKIDQNSIDLGNRILTGLRAMKWGFLHQKDLTVTRKKGKGRIFEEICYSQEINVPRFYHPKPANASEMAAENDAEVI